MRDPVYDHSYPPPCNPTNPCRCMNRRSYRTRRDSRTDVFGSVERVHDAGRRKRLALVAVAIRGVRVP